MELASSKALQKEPEECNMMAKGRSEMYDNKPKYYNDDGTEFNPDLIPKPSLCTSCKKDGLPGEEVLCNLTRADQQGEDEFVCETYEEK